MVLLATQPRAKTSKSSVEVIIARPCMLIPVGVTTIQHAAIGSKMHLTEADARTLVMFAGKAFYLDREDDPTTDGRWTLSPETRGAIDAELALIAQRDAAQAHARAVQHAAELALIERFKA